MAIPVSASSRNCLLALSRQPDIDMITISNIGNQNRYVRRSSPENREVECIVVVDRVKNMIAKVIRNLILMK